MALLRITRHYSNVRADVMNQKPSMASTDLLIGLGTIPLLAGLISAKALSEMMQSVGQFSEEVFRGDRLPVLNLTDPPTPGDDDESR